MKTLVYSIHGFDKPFLEKAAQGKHELIFTEQPLNETTSGRTYHAMAALLQIDKPEIEISRLSYPLFSPTKDWEKDGIVNNVVFPTGHALFGSDLYIYYGAADKYIAVAKLDINDLLLELRKQP